MYRICLFLCIFNVIVLAQNDEAKYIDLLPETEKQEFLNRIARRILEEIQSKDSPEQTHAQVSDAQLNVHHSYVRDLIKEETENLKNVRRDSKEDNDAFEKGKSPLSGSYNDDESDRMHIDLTLRENSQKNVSKGKESHDTSASVIPVKVLYDENSKNIEEKNGSNHIFPNSPLSKNSELLSNRNDTVENGLRNMSQVSDKSKTAADINRKNNFFDGSVEKIRSFANDSSDVNEKIKVIPIVSNGKPVDNNSTSLPLITELKTQPTSNNNKIEKQSITTTSLPLQTHHINLVKTTPSPITKKQEDGNQLTKSDTKRANGNKTAMTIDKKEQISKPSLRSRAGVLYKEYEEEEESHKIYTPERYKNNQYKKYVAYEAPAENQILLQNSVPKDHEEPYSIPVYNFAPSNAYYNPYNYFGINNNEEDLLQKTPINYNEEAPDPFLRSGVVIDLNEKNGQTSIHLNSNDNNPQHRYLIKLRYNPPWANESRTNRNSKNKNSQVFNKNHKSIHSNRHNVHGKNHPVVIEHGVNQQLFPKVFKFQSPNFADSKSRPKEMLAEDYILDANFDDRNSATNSDEEVDDIDLDYYFGRKWDTSLEKDLADKNIEFKGQPEHVDLTMKLSEIDVTWNRKKTAAHNLKDRDFVALLTVLKDMIYRDRYNLVTYNWLQTTVEIESAIEKLLCLIEDVEKGIRIHPLDLQLLTFVAYLYDTSNALIHQPQTKIQKNTLQSQTIRDVNDIVAQIIYFLRRNIRRLPKNKKMKPGQKIKNPINMWYKYYLKTDPSEDHDLIDRTQELLRHLKIFLEDIRNNLYELHYAIREIASITKYEDQHWYEDLKSIYFNTASEKRLLEVILHLATSRMLSSMEQSAKNGGEEFLPHIRENNEVTRRMQEEFVFVMGILDRMQKL